MSNFLTEVEMTQLGLRLRHFREHKGVSREQIAKDSGLSRSTIQLYESGQRMVSAEYLLACHHLFNADIHWLLTGKSSILQVDELPPRDEAFLEQIHGLSTESCNHLVDFLMSLKKYP